MAGFKQTGTGWLTEGSGGGGGGASSDISDASALGGPTVLASLDNADERLVGVEPTATVAGSAVFVAGVWQTVWTRAVAEGEACTVRIANGYAYTGTASTVTNSQFRYYNAFRRQTGGGATISTGAPGVQGNIAVSQIRLIASGSNVELQLSFNVSATITYKLPIYIEAVDL